MKVGERIKYIREIRGMLQKDLAKNSHCSPNAIGYYERGLSEPPFSAVVKIAKALDVDIGIFADKDITDERSLDCALESLTEKPIEKTPFQSILEDVKSSCELVAEFCAAEAVLECATKIYIEQIVKEREKQNDSRKQITD